MNKFLEFGLKAGILVGQAAILVLAMRTAENLIDTGVEKLKAVADSDRVNKAAALIERPKQSQEA